MSDDFQAKPPPLPPNSPSAHDRYAEIDVRKSASEDIGWRPAILVAVAAGAGLLVFLVTYFLVAQSNSSRTSFPVAAPVTLGVKTPGTFAAIALPGTRSREGLIALEARDWTTLKGKFVYDGDPPPPAT